ncbi:hypothetical protein L9F63_007073, partial [Diploptera punctata]
LQRKKPCCHKYNESQASSLRAFSLVLNVVSHTNCRISSPCSQKDLHEAQYNMKRWK